MAVTQDELYATLDLDLSWSEAALPERERTKHVHRLHPYHGKFIPQLVEKLLDRYFAPGEHVFDPFAGSGTTLVQALESGLDATGLDVAAFNCLLMRVKTAEYDLTELEEELRDAYVRIEELERNETDRLRLLDLWTYQKREIEDARLQPGEDERLESEKLVLANAEKIYNAAMNAFDLLYDGDSSTAASLRSARKQVEELARYEPRFQEALAALESALISVEDVGATVRDFAGGIHASPEHLAEVEERLATIDRLKRKYGPSLADVIGFGAETSQKLSEMENKDEVLRGLRVELSKAAQDYLTAAGALSKKRCDAARKLEKLVEAAIHDLAMTASFRIEVAGSENQENWSACGFDAVVYMISTNPGEPLQRLEHIASGGELSRVMLALKASVETTAGGAGRKKGSGVPRTLVFDEIDTGIGGRAAEAVGRKLKDLARINQVLCVTHLPQIATFADHHYRIDKKESAGRTKTSIRNITGDERTEEVARMLSGAKVTESSLKHAEQMIKSNA